MNTVFLLNLDHIKKTFLIFKITILSCVWSQERKGEIMYNGSEISQQMDIVFTPALAANTRTR